MVLAIVFVMFAVLMVMLVIPPLVLLLLPLAGGKLSGARAGIDGDATGDTSPVVACACALIFLCVPGSRGGGLVYVPLTAPMPIRVELSAAGELAACGISTGSVDEDDELLPAFPLCALCFVAGGRGVKGANDANIKWEQWESGQGEGKEEGTTGTEKKESTNRRDDCKHVCMCVHTSSMARPVCGVGGMDYCCMIYWLQ